MATSAGFGGIAGAARGRNRAQRAGHDAPAGEPFQRMKDLRLISFLPAATEMACALGLEEQLVGVSHECDFPARVRHKPIVVRCALPVETMTLAEIDVVVAERMRNGQSIYAVDQRVVEQLAPTHILTQTLCEVCAPSTGEVARALKALPSKPHIFWFTPHGIEDIFENLRELGAGTGRSANAEEVIAAARARLQRVAELTRTAQRPRVFCLEWIDPYYCCGHWVPEMVQIAGGQDALGRKGADSVRMAWSDIAAWSPEILIVSPCGFGVEKAAEQARRLLQQPGWSELPAVRNGQVFAVDANAYFARPGPRVVDGVELLAHLFHPERCEWHGPADAFQRVS
jgi:iron complex transport system substrate-binding protein